MKSGAFIVLKTLFKCNYHGFYWKKKVQAWLDTSAAPGLSNSEL